MDCTVDLSAPKAPEFAGCFSDHGYVHDTQCVVYEGPDAHHAGCEVCFNSAATYGQMPEIGWFDLCPENDNATFEGGTWSNYPYYKSRTVAVSSMDRGLFLLQPRGNR